MAGNDTDDLTSYRFPGGAMNVAQFIIQVEAMNANLNIPLLRKAYEYTDWAHRGQKRRSGNPFIEHSLNVAFILAQQHLDSDTVAAGLLHDVVEDTAVTIEEIERQFSAEIAALVDGVTKLSAYEYKSRKELQAEYFRKMLLSMANDIRVIIIKLADRLHNMRTLSYLEPEKRRQIATETKEIYGPLAHRFGMARIKWELEDLSLKTLQPQVYEDLVRRIDGSRVEREAYLNEVSSALQKMMREEKLEVEVSGRVKHFDSVYRKIAHRKVPFDQIYDLIAVRVLTETVNDCYHVLGVIHNHWTPVADRFNDYIAVPKHNMYQSLHTTVVGPRGRMVEIQIRTHAMHRVAEFGIAAHWLYKEGKQELEESDRQLAWLREIINWQQEASNPEEFLEYLKIDLFQDEVYVFTPDGEIKHLRRGATALDFAFAVHTDVGLHCTGTKVNGRLVPFDTELVSGDEAEVLTSPHAEPSRDWLRVCQTTRARTKIKKHLRQKGFDEAARLGKEMLDRTLRKKHIKAPETELLTDVALALSYLDLEQMYAAIGRGDLDVERVLNRLFPPGEEEPPRESIVKGFVDRARGGRDIRVQGMNNLMFRFAKCCQPVPGERIIGFITRGRGLTIHRADCVNAVQTLTEPERKVDVSWDVAADQGFLVKLLIVVEDRKRILLDINEAIAGADADVRAAELHADEATAVGSVVVQIKNINHLNRVIERIKKRVRGVIRIERAHGGDSEPDGER